MKEGPSWETRLTRIGFGALLIWGGVEFMSGHIIPDLVANTALHVNNIFTT